MAADEPDLKTAAKPTVSAKLKPVKAPPAKMGTETPAPQTPTREQVELWNSLGDDQKLALREREAVRLFAQGLEHHRQGELEDAIKLYGQALMLNQTFPDIYNNMGVALRAAGKKEASAACYQRALALKPDHSGAYTNLGNVLRELGRLEAAIASHQRAVALDPGSAGAVYNLGLAQRDLGQTDEALRSFDKTLELDPAHPDCRWDRSLSLLQKGDLEEGFDEYEWRWKISRAKPRDFTQPLWDGSDLKGKTILLHQEQGFGDMIHFARYIPMVKAKGGTIVVETHPELSRLFSTIDGVGQVVNGGSDLPKFDVYAPMLSLPRILGTTLANLPADVPYLKPPDAHTGLLPATMSTNKKIGIAWAGRSTHRNDANRSCTFNDFIELMGFPNTALYSLQYGPPSADIQANGCEALVTNLGGKVRDFADTAGVISELDLVITVDTAIAHLAGALGKPTWVVLPTPGDWRWMLDRPDSPWYPSMRLFRQPQPGDWKSVFEAVKQALEAEVSGKA
ncbi:MAG: glycosyltransferase family protein [Rhodospirillales bacterium]|nr:glycosyltransferase family protein [Rhodospirillales bacterium]